MNILYLLQTRFSQTLFSNTLGRALVLKHSAKLLKRSAELLKAYKEIESSAECLKSSVAYLCYNMTHAVPISHGKFSFTIRL